MKELIDEIEKWHKDLLPIVKKDSPTIKDDLIQRASKINDPSTPAEKKAIEEILAEMDQVSSVDESVRDVFTTWQQGKP